MDNVPHVRLSVEAGMRRLLEAVVETRAQMAVSSQETARDRAAGEDRPGLALDFQLRSRPARL